MYELPPILRGTEQQQLEALRDYLVRLVRELERKDEERGDNGNSSNR